MSVMVMSVMEKRILTRVLDFSCEEPDSIILSSKEDNRLCRFANGDYGNDDIKNENDIAEPTQEDEGEESLPVRLPELSLAGWRATLFVLR